MRGHVLRLGIILALLGAMVVVRFLRARSEEVGRRNPATFSTAEKIQPAPPPLAPSRLLYRGRVVDEHGRPLPGVRVAWPAASPDEEAPSLETAADGGFEIAIDASAPAGLDLILVAGGYRPLRRSMGPTKEGARVTFMLTFPLPPWRASSWTRKVGDLCRTRTSTSTPGPRKAASTESAAIPPGNSR